MNNSNKVIVVSNLNDNNLFLQIMGFIFILAFVTLIAYLLHQYITQHLHRKYQGHLRIKQMKLPGCLAGCTKNGECPYGNYCYDDLGPNPSCCAYDFQCNQCKKLYSE